MRKRMFDVFGLRSKHEQMSEAIRLRNTTVLYWIISPDRKQIKGPYLDVPMNMTGWTVLGFKGDIFGTISHREPYETFEGVEVVEH